MQNTSNLPVRLTYCPHPFKVERYLDKIDYGKSLQQILENIQPVPWLRSRATISINGNLIPEENWSIVPKQDSLVVIRVLPAGGKKKGGKVRGILGIVVAIASLAASVATGGLLGPTGMALMGSTMAGIFGGLAGMATGIIGNLLINALVPPPKGTVSAGQDYISEQATPTQYIDGARNQINRWGVVPRLYGYRRVVPLKCATDFTDIIGNDHYVTCLFTIGYAPVQISDLKIGETDLFSFQGVEIEYRNLTFLSSGGTATVYGNDPHKLFTQGIEEEQFSILLTLGQANLRTTQLGCTAVSIDVTFPNGLYTLASDEKMGGYFNHAIAIKVEYKESTETVWTLFEDWILQGSSSKSVRFGKKINVNPTGDPEKKYNIRLTKLSGDSYWTSYTQESTCYWTALRNFKNQNSIAFPDEISTIALRVKATDQLNGTIDEFNCIAKSILLDWDSSSATWTERITNNPASIYRSVLQDEANPKPLTDSRIDLTKIQYWHEYCTANSWAYNKVIDAPTSIYNLLSEVAASGRAAVCESDSKWSVILDEDQTSPAQIFTPRNSWDLQVELNYPDMPHGLRCSFNNEQQDYQKDERFVLDDYYQTDGLDAWNHSHPEYAQATIFEQIDLPGITNPNNVFKLARYHLASAKLRPRSIIFKCDFEHLAVTRGDLVHIAHDVMLVGLGSGRINSLLFNESNDMIGVVLDTRFNMEQELEYCLRFRIPDLTTISLQKEVSNISLSGWFMGGWFTSPWFDTSTDYTYYTTTATFYFVDPISEGELMPGLGDLALFGELDYEMIPAIVKNITTSSDLNAEVTCVDAATAIHNADIGTIPKFIPGHTLPPEWRPPDVDRIRSDIGVMIYDGNSWFVNIFVLIKHYSRKGPPFPANIECVFNAIDSEIKTTIFSNDINEIRIMPVNSGFTYDFQLRYVYSDGSRSKWTSVIRHRVLGISLIPDVTNLVSFYNGSRLYIKWDNILSSINNPTYPGLEYEVRKGSTWNNADILGITKENQFAISGDGFYWVAAKVQNKYSDNPTSIEISGSTNFLTNIYIENEESDGGWLGTKSFTTVAISGNLELSGKGLFDSFTSFTAVADLDIEGGIASTGYYTTASADLGDAQSCNLYVDINSTVDALYANAFSVPDFDDIVNFDGDYGNTTSVKPQVAIASTTIFADWQDFTPGIYYGRKFKFRIRLTTTDVKVTPAVERFKWIIDLPDRIESNTVTIASAGSTIFYSKQFHVAPAPIISIYNALSGDEISLSSSTTASFDIQIINSGSGVARTIHWIAKSY